MPDRLDPRTVRVLDGVLEGFILLDKDLKIVEINAEACRIEGRRRDDVIGRPLLELWPNAEAMPAYAAYRLARAENRSVEITARHRTGAIDLWLHVRAHPTSEGLAVFYQDVTERVRAEEALAESEARLRLAAELAEVGVFDWNLVTGEVTWERAISGVPPSDGVFPTIADVLETIAPEDRARVGARLAAAMDPAGDGAYQAEYRPARLVGADAAAPSPPGSVISARGRVWFENGTAVRMIGTVVDVAALRAAEAIRARDQRELEERVKERTLELERTQARLLQSEKMTALGQLAGGVAHDFNNVMQTVMGAAALVDARADDPTAVRRLAGMIEQAAARGGSLTRRLLSFSRRGELRAEAVDVAALLDSLKEVFGHTLGPRVRVVVSCPPDPPFVQADRGQLEAALINLAANARDAMPAGGAIRIVVDLKDPQAARQEPVNGLPCVRFRVIDEGVGIAPETLARVTEPFFTTKSPEKGTGLGLSIAQSFAEQSGGALEIESVVGEGTVVSLYVPTAAPCAPKTSAPPLWTLGPTARVLLVDDEHLVRDVVGEQLRARGFEVLAAACGEDALALLPTEAPFDALITDRSMPGMDGLELIREVRAQRPDLPAILLTGFAGDADEIAGSGDFSVLRKPAAADVLAERLRALINARKTALDAPA